MLNVERLMAGEVQSCILGIATYQDFQSKAETIKDNLLFFLIEAKRQDKKVAGYGAAAKSITLLNFIGVKPDFLPFVCAAALSKQGKFLPGSHIPILPPAALADFRPDYVLIPPWNIKLEVMEQLLYIKESGVRFVTAIPSLRTHGIEHRQRADQTCWDNPNRDRKDMSLGHDPDSDFDPEERK